MKKIFVFAVNFWLIFSFSLTPAISLAQEEGGPPADIQKGPSQEEISQFQQEIGAPPEAFASHGPTQMTADEVKSLPEDVKKYASESEMVALYCAMTRWKSGDFFSAMDALQNYMAPALEKVKALGVDVSVPNFLALKADGQKKVEAICSTKTVDEAESLAQEFRTWGQNDVQQKVDQELRTSLEEKIKVKSDGLKEKVQTEVQAFVDQETKVMEEEIKQKVDTLVESKKSQLESMAKSNPSGVQAVADSMRGQIDSEIQAFVDAKIKQMKDKIKTKVDEIVGPQKKQFEDVGAALSEAGSKIDEGVKAGRSQYEKYKEEAFVLRKKLVFSMLDKNLEEGLKQLEAASADIENAKKDDPTIQSVGEVKSALTQDRKILEDRLNAALDAGDDTAFEQALLDFKTKWEAYRTDMEKVAKQAIGKACTIALAQFGSSRTQIDKGLEQITGLQGRCANNASEECSLVNTFSDRFNTVSTKFTDIKTEIGLAEKMCQQPEVADRENLVALMKKIQDDAGDLKKYGQALEAEKNKAIANSAKDACAKALPQIRAAQSEIKNNDLVILQNNLNKCKGKSTDECKMVMELNQDFVRLTDQINRFNRNKDQAEKLCLGVSSESDMKKLVDALDGTKNEGASARLMAKQLQSKQAEKASDKAFCKPAMAEVSIGKSKMSTGLNDLSVNFSSCSKQKKKTSACTKVMTLSSKLEDARNQVKNVFNKADNLEAFCKKAGSGLPTDQTINYLKSFKDEGQRVEKLMEDLRSEVSAIK